MTPYVSPDHFRAQGTGIDLTGIDDFELANMLGTASDAANSLVAAPDGYDFRGGTRVGERHQYRLSQSPFEEAQRRVYLYCWPLLSVESMRIQVANAQYVDFPQDDLYVSRRYVDIVSLTMTVNGLGAAVLPIIGLTAPEVITSYTYGWRYDVTNDRCYATDGRTFRAQNQWWLVDDDHTPEIKVNGVVVTTDFTIDADEGVVRFDFNQAADAVVTASYTHKLPPGIMRGVIQLCKEDLGQREIAGRGMSGLASIKVGEITLEKERPKGAGTSAALLSQASQEVQKYLNGFNFIWGGAGR